MLFKRMLIILICGCFLMSHYPADLLAADIVLPEVGRPVYASAPLKPIAIKGLKVDPSKPFRFEFLLSQGDQPIGNRALLKEEIDRLVKYFLACLTLPEESLWVNLSPYEKNRIVPETLGQTDLGRGLLAQDYILKQLSASLIDPRIDLGQKFWERVYVEAKAKYGSTQIPLNTYNKVWVLADRARVLNQPNGAYVLDSHLKVMMEEDFLAQRNNDGRQSSDKTKNREIASITHLIYKDIILPEIEKEVNTGSHFSHLRQIFQAFILATWYKKNFQSSVINSAYANKEKVTPIYSTNKQDPNSIYEQYLKAYKKGAINLISDEKSVPRKYFSGGTQLRSTNIQSVTPAQLTQADKTMIAQADYAVTVDLEITGVENLSNKDNRSSDQALKVVKELSPEAYGMILSLAIMEHGGEFDLENDLTRYYAGMSSIRGSFIDKNTVIPEEFESFYKDIEIMIEVYKALKKEAFDIERNSYRTVDNIQFFYSNLHRFIIYKERIYDFVEAHAHHYPAYLEVLCGMMLHRLEQLYDFVYPSESLRSQVDLSKVVQSTYTIKRRHAGINTATKTIYTINQQGQADAFINQRLLNVALGRIFSNIQDYQDLHEINEDVNVVLSQEDEKSLITITANGTIPEEKIVLSEDGLRQNLFVPDPDRLEFNHGIGSSFAAHLIIGMGGSIYIENLPDQKIRITISLPSHDSEKMEMGDSAQLSNKIAAIKFRFKKIPKGVVPYRYINNRVRKRDERFWLEPIRVARREAEQIRNSFRGGRASIRQPRRYDAHGKQAPGGIQLNPQDLNLSVQSISQLPSGSMDQATLSQLQSPHFSGFYPVIVDIRSIHGANELL